MPTLPWCSSQPALPSWRSQSQQGCGRLRPSVEQERAVGVQACDGNSWGAVRDETVFPQTCRQTHKRTTYRTRSLADLLLACRALSWVVRFQTPPGPRPLHAGPAPLFPPCRPAPWPRILTSMGLYGTVHAYNSMFSAAPLVLQGAGRGAAVGGAAKEGLREAGDHKEEAVRRGFGSGDEGRGNRGNVSYT